MHTQLTRRAIAAFAVVLGLCALPASAASEKDKKEPALEYENPRPGQPGHRPHIEWQGAYPKPGDKGVRVVRVLTPPHGFLGNMTYDAARNRLFLVALGKPTNPNGSKIYEMDVESGQIVREAALPLIGDFGDPVYIDGFVYQPVYHESKMYKISVLDEGEFGQVMKEIPLPTHADLNLVDESHPYPFIEFGGAGVTEDNNILFHADDVGEFVTVDRETGRILSRVRTIKALGGLEAVPFRNQQLVIANSDPRGGYCALSFPPALSRSPEQKDISWALLDGKSGEVLASIRTQNSRAYAASVAMYQHRPLSDEKKDYGVFSFFAFGEEGILVLEWNPLYDAY